MKARYFSSRRSNKRGWGGINLVGIREVRDRVLEGIPTSNDRRGLGCALAVDSWTVEVTFITSGKLTC